MRVIDLLIKIANGEDVPKKIKYDKSIFEYKKGFNRDKEYICIDAIDNLYKEVHINKSFDEIYKIPLILNDEIEIIEDIPKEDKKIEKLSDELTYIKLVDNKTFRKNIVNKINEIIDKVNGE